MPSSQPDLLTRLKALNPAETRHELGRGPTAQATLHRVLNDQAPPRLSLIGRLRARVPRGGLGVALAALVLGVGGAVAATTQLGWWSTSPSSARYAINPAAHVRTPRATQIHCRAAAGERLPCSADATATGQLYIRTGSVQLSGRPSAFTRAGMKRAIAQARLDGRLTPARAPRVERDLAAVPDSFFTEFQLAARYQTMGGGDGRVPPAGIPEFLICQDGAPGLNCQNLNGDRHAPIGAEIYMAQPDSRWTRAPGSARTQGLGLPPGISFTRSDYRLLVDLMSVAAVGHSSGGN